MVQLDDIIDWVAEKFKKPLVGDRIVHVNNAAENAQYKFCNNIVTTAKYNVLTFIPKNLFEQFTRIANLYFLVVSILQLTTGLSPTGRFGTAFPLVVVVLFQAAKDAFEDLKRHMSDRSVNNSKTRAIRNGELVEILWRDVKVGDILKVQRDEYFPADMVCLSSSEFGGALYVETAQLDGETNLKIASAVPQTHEMRTLEKVAQLKTIINCQHPNEVLTSFDGAMKYVAGAAKQEHYDKPSALEFKNQLLRGAALKNTEFVWGAVVYTGVDSKLMKNLRKTPHKRSKIENLTNYYILTLFLVLFVITLICVIAVAIWSAANQQKHWYVFYKHSSLITNAFDNPGVTAAKGIITYFILFNNFIPISLYVSMEMVKVFQSRLFMDKDLQMYYEEYDTPSNCKTSSLNEELGCIEYIFSDKTGTLTQNKMEFLKFSVNGIEYGKGTTEIGRAAAARQGIKIEDDRPKNWKPKDGFQFYDDRILDGKWRTEANANQLFEFFMLLAVCHTVIPETDKKDPNIITYQAASPDEGALVKAAKHLGFNFYKRTHDTVTVKVNEKDFEFKVLNTLEFNSTRKRFSVIVRTPDKKIILLTKGADSVIMERMKKGEHDQATFELLKKFAAEGLRTLLCAKRELDEETWAKWNKEEFLPASIATQNKGEKMMAVAESIEKDLVLIGSTAIEDKLQEGVPDTIATLAQASIKIWVLTGDKQETAINIGFACAMLDNDMTIIVLNEKDRFKLWKQIVKSYQEVLEKKKENPKMQFGVVIDGESLTFLLPKKTPFVADKKQRAYEQKHSEIPEMTFLRLCMMCKSVICCRVSPLQKSQIVKLVKDNLKGSITLAIGDGANDVSMIQAAHIGVGISGEEGLQAARAADYSFAQFRYLKRLLLVHGRYNYRRIAKLICFSFYKNAIVQLTQFWFILFNGFSGKTLYDNTANALYNVIWTSFPIMALAIMDKDVSPDASERCPKLYTYGQHDYYFNIWTFVGWLVNACFHSLVIFFIPYIALEMGMFHNGKPVDSELFGVLLYTAIILVVTFKVVFETSAHNIGNWIIVIFTIVVWPAFLLVYCVLLWILPNTGNRLITLNSSGRPSVTFFDTLYNDSRNTLRFYYFVGYEAAINPLWWAVLFITVIVCLARDIAWKAFKRMVAPELYHIVQNLESNKEEVSNQNVLDHYPKFDTMAGKVRPIKALPSDMETKLQDAINFWNNLPASDKAEDTKADDKKDVKADHLENSTGYAFSQIEGGQIEMINALTEGVQTGEDVVVSSKKNLLA